MGDDQGGGPPRRAAVPAGRGLTAEQAFSAEAEREVCERVLGDRRHGLSPRSAPPGPATSSAAG